MAQEKDLMTLIRQFLEHLEIERNCSRLTVRNYKHYLEVFCTFLEKEIDKAAMLSDINQDTVRRFRLYLSRQKGVEPNSEMKIVTQGYYIIALRSFLKWLVKNDYQTMQPEKLDVPKNKNHSFFSV